MVGLACVTDRVFYIPPGIVHGVLLMSGKYHGQNGAPERIIRYRLPLVGTNTLVLRLDLTKQLSAERLFASSSCYQSSLVAEGQRR